MQSKFFFLSAAFTALLLLPVTTSAQVWIDGIPQTFPPPYNEQYQPYVENYGNVGIVMVNGIAYSNGGYRYCFLDNYGTIGEATIQSFCHDRIILSGSMRNFGTVDTVYLTGTYDDTSPDPGSIGGIVNLGAIGTLYLDHRGRSLENGTFTAPEEGIIGSLHVSAGIVINHRNGVIGNLILSGNGVIENNGRISKMTYIDGIYRRISNYYIWEGSGTIGTLTLAGDAGNNTGNWGNIENLQFDRNGKGSIVLTATLNNNMAPTMEMAMAAVFDGIMPAGNAALPGISFAGIQADSIDFTNGSISFNLSALTSFSGITEEELIASLFVAGDGFLFSALFGAAEISGMEGLHSLQLAKGDEFFYIFNDGVIASGWDFDLTSGLARWDGMTTIEWISKAEVPEPATLLILGLGLAGLPIVRRWRRR